jgi:small-conductance mechanosensitive channel
MNMSFLDDLWTEIQSYYDGIILLLPRLVTASLVFLFLYLLANRVRKLVFRKLDERLDDHLLATFLANSIKILILITAGLLFLRILGLGGIAGSLLASAGLGAFVLGFALKDIMENFLAGILLAFNRPFSTGDIISLEGIEGEIVAMTLRNIHIKTSDGRDVFIPNANVLKQPLINLTIDGDLRFDFTLGFDYGSDIEKAVQIVLDTLAEVPGIMTEPRKPFVMVSELGASTLNLTCYYWIDRLRSGGVAPYGKEPGCGGRAQSPG